MEIPFTELQGKYLAQVFAAKQAADRDLSNAVALIAAGHDYELPDGAQYKIEQGKIIVTESVSGDKE